MSWMDDTYHTTTTSALRYGMMADDHGNTRHLPVEGMAMRGAPRSATHKAIQWPAIDMLCARTITPYGAPKRESGNKSLLYVELIDLHVSWQQFAEQDGFFFSVKRRK